MERNGWEGEPDLALRASGEEMRIADHVEAIDLPMRLWGADMTIYPALLWDDAGGATLVDTGLPQHAGTILERMRDLGLRPGDLRRILLTHQDVDHVGGAKEIARATGARVYAHSEDVPYIQGERRIIKTEPARTAARIAALPEADQRLMRDLFAVPPSATVDELVEDGQELPWHGGLAVVHTPGHTPGHIAVYLRAHRLLLAGDAMRVESGELLGPNPVNTLDMGQATAALGKFLKFPVERVLCFHGGLYGPGALPRLRELSAS